MLVRHFSVLVLLLVFVVLCPGSARAQEASEEELIASGIALRKEGRDAEALVAFARAQALHPSARAVAQIALAHQALAHWREAERSLLDALSHSNDAWIARHRVHLVESMTAVQTHLAWLSVDSSVEGAELWIGGERVGRLPLDGPVRVVTGALTVEVRASGYATSSRTLQIEAGAQLHESFPLVEVPPPVPAGPAPIVRLEPPTTPAPADHATERAPPGRRTAAWLTLAGAGALLAGGITVQALREHEVGLYNDDGLCLRGPGSRDDQCGSHRNAANTDTAAAVALYAGAAVAALASGSLFVLSRASSASRPAAARVSCGIAGLGAACGGVF